MSKLYLASVEYYSEYDEKEKTTHAIYAAESYQDAMKWVINDWGEDELITVTIHALGDDEEGYSVMISESMADAFLHDIVEDVYCAPSEWRMKRIKEGKE